MPKMKLMMAVAVSTAVLAAGCANGSDTASGPDAGQSQDTQATADGEKLRILLVNDDGWDAGGIRAVYAALNQAGHQVTVVAPSGPQSGMGGKRTFRGSITATHPDLTPFPEYAGANVWAVGPAGGNTGGTPSDAALFGLSTVFKDQKPDLVISGTNKGQNASATLNNSGTWNAAQDAAETGVPAIAISTEVAEDYDDEHKATPDFVPSAAYLVDLVEALTANSKDRGNLIPSRTVLNVNYPMAPAKGTKITALGSKDLFPMSYQEAEPGVYKVAFTYGGDRDDEGLDTGALSDGYASISVVGSNYGTAPDTAWLEPVLNKLD